MSIKAQNENEKLKAEREKTIKEVLEYVESVEISGSTYWAGLIEKHFLSSDPVGIAQEGVQTSYSFGIPKDIGEEVVKLLTEEAKVSINLADKVSKQIYGAMQPKVSVSNTPKKTPIKIRKKVWQISLENLGRRNENSVYGDVIVAAPNHPILIFFDTLEAARDYIDENDSDLIARVGEEWIHGYSFFNVEEVSCTQEFQEIG